ncbi:MAG: CHASE2 domain-containing protein, partial [Candidatus Gastranaerophilaceae bacterium]
MKIKSFVEKYYLSFFIIFGFLILVIFWNLGLGNLINSIELLTYDWRAQIATDKGPFHDKFFAADKNIVLLSADDISFSKLDKYSNDIGVGRWPWKRETWASVIDYVQKGNPKAIIFDIKFEGIEGNSVENKNSDMALSKSLYGKNVVIAVAATIDRKTSCKDQVNDIIKQTQKHHLLDKLTQNNLDLIIDSWWQSHSDSQ